MNVTDYTNSPNALHSPVSMRTSNLTQGFWSDIRDLLIQKSLPDQYKKCNDSGRFSFFSNDSSAKAKEFIAPDSDVYKLLEALIYADLQTSYFDNKIDFLKKLIINKQEESGYLNTQFNYERDNDAWNNLKYDHELYCGGHLIQASIALSRVKNDQSLIDVAIKWANHIYERFITQKSDGAPGHPCIEMALVELYRETRQLHFLELADHFIKIRGTQKSTLGKIEELVDVSPINVQHEVYGHAVRQLYLLCGITDLYSESGDQDLRNRIMLLWKNYRTRKMYITGGTGSRYTGESFGANYELPDKNAYCETCAAVASFMWNWRMLLLTGKKVFAVEMERVLLNTILSSLSYDGIHYFYTNPLKHDGKKDIGEHHRGSNLRTDRHWDHVPCCPTNISRILLTLHNYIYSTSNDQLYIHQFISNKSKLVIFDTEIEVEMNSSFPQQFTNRIVINTQLDRECTIKIRIPWWCNEPDIEFDNSDSISFKYTDDNYIELYGNWKGSTTINLDFPTAPKLYYANPNITNLKGKSAVMLGPIVYCLESNDFKDTNINDISISHNDLLSASKSGGFLHNMPTIHSRGYVWDKPDKLYNTFNNNNFKTIDLNFIPYFLWANRKPGAMSVWIAHI